MPRSLPPLHAQERMWLFERLEPATPVYHIQRVFGWTGRLDLGAVESSLRAITVRHDGLRTSFKEDGGRLWQVVADRPEVDFERQELQIEPSARSAAIARLADEQGRRTFDLRRAPLWRVLIASFAPDQHALIYTMHQMAGDGGALLVWLNELTACYQAYRAGGEPDLAPVTMQAGDVAAWEREELRGTSLAAAGEFWRSALAGAPAYLDLPFDGPARAGDYAGDWVLHTLEARRLAELWALTAATGATQFNVMLAALALLLSRLAGSEDVVIGAPVARRRRPGWLGVFAPLLNTVPLRLRIDGDATFATLLQQARTVTRAALVHGDLPFERIVSEAQVARSPEHGVLFDVLINQQPAEDELTMADARLTPLPRPCLAAKFPIGLYLVPGLDRLTLRLDYQVHRFGLERVELLADALLAILDQATSP